MSTYPYGTKGGPAVGGGLPGLPRRSMALPGVDINAFPTLVRIVRADEVYRISDWASFARVTAIGKGGLGGRTVNGGGGGGGGGLSGTDYERVTPGTIITSSFSSSSAGATIAIFHNTVLSGGNGGNGSNGIVGIGGIGSGGFVNFNGGNGGFGNSASGGGGGGAAGRGSNGFFGGTGVAGSVGGIGGKGGVGVDYFQGGAGGGGGASPNGDGLGGMANKVLLLFASAVLQAGLDGLGGVLFGGTQGNGGDGGGGGGGGTNTAAPNIPGSGLVIIEVW